MASPANGKLCGAVTDAEKKIIDLLVDDAELERRKKAYVAPAFKYNRGTLYKVCMDFPRAPS